MTGFSSPSYDALIRAAANVERFAADPERLLARVAHPDALRALLARRAQAADGAARRAWIEEARFVLLGEAALFGSVSQAVATHAPCSVEIVRASQRAQEQVD